MILADSIAFLQSLAFDDIGTRQHTIDAPLPGTSIWLFERPEFRSWLEGRDLQTNKGMLWIKGTIGSGKSVLMKQMLVNLKDRTPRSTVVSFFFNARGAILEKSSSGLYRSLVHQLLDDHRDLLLRLLPRFQKKSRSMSPGWKWHEREIQDLLVEIATMSLKTSLVILVDALDECENQSDARKIVSFLRSLSSSAMASGSILKICLSSRHYPEITAPGCLEIFVEKWNDADIVTYVKSELSLDDSGAATQHKIAKKAGGGFFWVVLVIGRMTKARDRGDIDYVDKILAEVPTELEELLDDTIRGLESKDRPETLRLFQFVMWSRRALTLSELRDAMGLAEATRNTNSPAIDDIQMRRFVRSRTGDLISLSVIDRPSAPPVTIAHFSHEAVREFMMEKGFRALDSPNDGGLEGRAHESIKQSCIDYINVKELIDAPSDAETLRLRNGAIYAEREEWMRRTEDETKQQEDKDITEEDEEGIRLGNETAEARKSIRRTKFDTERLERWQQVSKLKSVPKKFDEYSTRYPFLQYALTFLYAHAKAAEIGGISQESLVQSLDGPVFEC
jgi:hypothetical protein